MNTFNNVFFSGSIFYSFITGLILLCRKKDHVFTSRLLGFNLLALGWYALIYVLVTSRMLIELPYTYRIFSPLYYLIPPFGYIYVRSILKGETRFRKNDWPHFIPTIINVIDLLPYYLSSAAYKQSVARTVANNIQMSYQVSSGFMPDIVHFAIRPLQGVIYIIFQWRLLYIAGGKIKRPFMPMLEHGGYWLTVLTFLGSVIYGGMAYITLSGFHYDHPATQITILLQCAAFFGMSLHLFMKPELLYGLQVVTDSKTAEPLAAPERNDQKKAVTHTNKKLTADYVKNCVELLENYIQVSERFRKKGITLNELAADLNIPATTLSFAINRHYGQRFTDFINHCRVKYVIERFKLNDWKGQTLEALANQAGFASRSAFYEAFKKVTGQNPSEYIASINSEDQVSV